MNLRSKLTLAVAALAAATMTTAVMRAQPGAATAKFDVASIKPCTEPAGRGGAAPSPGRLHINCAPAVALIRQAYVLFETGKMSTIGKGMSVEGGPAWISSDLYTVDAKAEGTPSQGTMLGPMMQALLEDRFKLKFHRKTREVPVYALTATKGSPKLQGSQEGSCFAGDPDHPFVPPPPGQRLPPVCRTVSPTKDGLDVRGVTMANFCMAISAVLDRPVIDKTGIAGIFDVHLDVPPAELAPFALRPPPPPPGAATDPAVVPTQPDPGDIFLTIQSAVQKLGLKLESTKGPGQFLVIDHIEKPSEN